jgi:hypothetical protein
MTAWQAGDKRHSLPVRIYRPLFVVPAVSLNTLRTLSLLLCAVPSESSHSVLTVRFPSCCLLFYYGSRGINGETLLIKIYASIDPSDDETSYVRG